MTPQNTRRALAMALAIAALASGAHGQTVPSRDENAALRYWTAFAQMQDLPPESGGRESDLGSSLSQVETGAIAWDEARFGPVLDANAAALDTLMRASRVKACDWGLEYELGPTAPIVYLAKARTLARLNTLAGLRLTSQGNAEGAAARWLAGIRFARHSAEGGTLIAALSAWSQLRSTFWVIQRTARTGGIDSNERQRLAGALRALPVTGFDWGAALRNEQRVLDAFVLRLRAAANPQQLYDSIAGKTAAGRLSLPAEADITAFHRFIDRAADALAQDPEAAGRALAAIERERSALHAFYQGSIPMLGRINETRGSVKLERDRTLTLLK